MTLIFWSLIRTGISDNVTVLFGACDLKLLYKMNPLQSLTLMQRSKCPRVQSIRHLTYPVRSQVSKRLRTSTAINRVTEQFLDLSLRFSTGIRSDRAALESARVGVPAVINSPEGVGKRHNKVAQIVISQNLVSPLIVVKRSQ